MSADAEPEDDSAGAPSEAEPEPRASVGPTRGFLGLTAAATSPLTTAGTDFSIFVLVQNPFDVPVTIHEVQTHIPVELIDVNHRRLKQLAMEADNDTPDKSWLNLYRVRRRLRAEHSGVATAVGTELSPKEAGSFFTSSMHVDGDIAVESGGFVQLSGIGIHLPPGADSDRLDALMRKFGGIPEGYHVRQAAAR